MLNHLRHPLLQLSVSIAIITCAGRAQAPVTRLNPAVKQIVDEISEERIAASLKKLEGFGTRHILSAKNDPAQGIGAAQRWLYEEFKSYSPRLQVSYHTFQAKKSARVSADVDLANVVAILPGTIHKDRYVLVAGHYDSLSIVRKAREAGAAASGEEFAGIDAEASAKQRLAPGVADDGSGTAAVLELARVMSKHEFDKSIIFIAFSAEEVGTLGSIAYAAEARKQNLEIEAVLNNDIIGSETSGNGRSANSTLRVFSEGPEDSPSRSLARYTKEFAERYVPSMKVDLVFRRDRFRRGGDHRPFVQQGYAAVRLTTPSENYANQHSQTDTFANMSVPYTSRVIRMNAAVLASLALAPRPPVVTRVSTTGTLKGVRVPTLGRGKSGYDAALRWSQPNPEPDLAGYSVVIRSTTSPLWEREIYVGNVTEYTIPDLSIDDVVIGVKAIDNDGNQSLVSAYIQETQEPAAAPAAPPPVTSAPTGESR